MELSKELEARVSEEGLLAGVVNDGKGDLLLLGIVQRGWSDAGTSSLLRGALEQGERQRHQTHHRKFQLNGGGNVFNLGTYQALEQIA